MPLDQADMHAQTLMLRVVKEKAILQRCNNVTGLNMPCQS